jgi:dihydrofolate reductase
MSLALLDCLFMQRQRRYTTATDQEATMRKLMVNTFLTLDGVMQAPGAPREDNDGGFTQGGWSVNYWDEQMGEVMTKAMETPFDLLLGRKTYDIFAAHWPRVSDEEGGKALNAATKYVVSRGRSQLD